MHNEFRLQEEIIIDNIKYVCTRDAINNGGCSDCDIPRNVCCKNKIKIGVCSAEVRDDGWNIVFKIKKGE